MKIKVAAVLLTTFKDNSDRDVVYGGHAHFLNVLGSIPPQIVHISVSFSGYNFININAQK